MTEAEAFYYFIQTCAGMHFLHKNGLIHRDLKPENLLVNSQNILKLCDFGWCVHAKADETRSTFCGTLEYMAPEMLKQPPRYGPAVDTWALGILLYELRHGHAPYSGNSAHEMSRSIERSKIRFYSHCS